MAADDATEHARAAAVWLASSSTTAAAVSGNGARRTAERADARQAENGRQGYIFLVLFVNE